MHDTDSDGRTLAQSLLWRCERTLSVLGPLTVVDAVITAPQPSPQRDPEFGMLVLSDGSAGLYYAWLGGEQARITEQIDPRALLGNSAVDVAARFQSDSDIERSLGIAAINAITQALYRAADFDPGTTSDSFGELALCAEDCLGMVGNFRPLVRRARDLGVKIRIVERKAEMVSDDGFVQISLDPSVLEGCNKIICTGATLLNDSLDDILAYCGDADKIALLGPTVGCFADDLLARGIFSIGGTRVTDARAAANRLRRREALGDSAEKTSLVSARYPGFDALLARASATTPP